MPLHVDTPLIASRPLSARTGSAVWLKLDALQPSGSFKLRGVGHACEVHAARGAKRFVASSGGNAGLAVAYASKNLGIPAAVVVPETTTRSAVELLRLEGAEVEVHGASWLEANAYANANLRPGDAFIHPFDDPLLWEGHASLVDEVAAAGLRPDAVLLSVGGGGLLCGVELGMRRHGWDDVPIIAVETEGAASFRAALDAGHTVELPQITSIATTLGLKRVCEESLRCVERHPVRSVVVSDLQALQACERFLADHRILVEPACGAALAVAVPGAPELQGFGTVLVIVCGGATATIDQIRAWTAALDPARG